VLAALRYMAAAFAGVCLIAKQGRNERNDAVWDFCRRRGTRSSAL